MTPFDIIASHTASRRVAQDILDALEAGGYGFESLEPVDVNISWNVTTAPVSWFETPGLLLGAPTHSKLVIE